MAAIFAVAATTDFFSLQRDELVFVLMVEGGFLLMQGTLVDIARRLKKRPPICAVALIVIGVVIFSRETLDVLRLAWQSPPRSRCSR